MCCSIFFFFFSSRRRHTRYWRDWSSDVCSSDLGFGQLLVASGEAAAGSEREGPDHAIADPQRDAEVVGVAELALALAVLDEHVADGARLDHHRAPLGHHLAAEALADLDPLANHR